MKGGAQPDELGTKRPVQETPEAAQPRTEDLGRKKQVAPSGLPGSGGVSLRFKIWLDKDGKAFGDGPFQLLQRVAELGSLRQAAIEMSMSYNKAWRLMRALETRLGFPLMERSVGGASGGGSELTAEARVLLTRYRAMHDEAEAALQEIFARHFGSESR